MNCSSKTGRELHVQKARYSTENRISVSGGMAERFKAHAWKACWGESPSGVRSPFLRHLHPELIDSTIYVSEVYTGTDIPRK